MEPERAAVVLKIWRKKQKKYTDALERDESKRHQEAMKRVDLTDDGVEYVGVKERPCGD